jgi:hypothetical protein
MGQCSIARLRAAVRRLLEMGSIGCAYESSRKLKEAGDDVLINAVTPSHGSVGSNAAQDIRCSRSNAPSDVGIRAGI